MAAPRPRGVATTMATAVTMTEPRKSVLTSKAKSRGAQRSPHSAPKPSSSPPRTSASDSGGLARSSTKLPAFQSREPTIMIVIASDPAAAVATTSFTRDSRARRFGFPLRRSSLGATSAVICVRPGKREGGCDESAAKRSAGERLGEPPEGHTRHRMWPSRENRRDQPMALWLVARMSSGRAT